MEAYYPRQTLERAMKVQEVILRAMSGELKWIEAAEIIGISDRSMRRWRDRYKKHGYDGLYDRRNKRPSPKRVPIKDVETVLKLYRENYFDFNIRHFHEKLIEYHDIHLSYNWIRLALIEAGLVSRRKRRDKHRKRRPRRPLVGMMLHIDGSPHDWLGAGYLTDIVAISDDANNKLYDIELVREEDSMACMRLLKSVVENYGIFCSLYSDRASHFFLTREAGEKVDLNTPTQVGRALQELGIQHIPSYSPQARGRSERLNGTLQGRLPQEFRLRGIKTIEDANRYLKNEYIKYHNKNFAIKAEQHGSAFIPIPANIYLDRVFCFKHLRTVNNDNTVSFENRIFQINKSDLRVSFAKCKVTVYEHIDGSITIGYGPHILGYYVFPDKLSTYSQYSQRKKKVPKKKEIATTTY